MNSDAATGSHGLAVEDRARQIAARLGLADFVYRPQLVARGRGTREPGDAVLYANGRGVIIQVKARDPGAARRDGPERAQRWILKSGRKAYQQGEGTRRQLLGRREQGSPVLALPVRAAHLPMAEQVPAALLLDMDMSQWPTVVVFDHPVAPGLLAPGQPEAFWITLTDWLELHRAIRSTTGLLDYIHRVVASRSAPTCVLGRESHRYSDVVRADRRYAAEGGPHSRPFLDYSAIEDPVGAELFRDVLERAWPEDGSLPRVPIEDYRLLMEHLDAIPPAAAAELGRWILDKRRYLSERKAWTGGAFLIDDRLTVYACDHMANYAHQDEFLAELMAVMIVRGLEVTEQGDREVSCAAIGVLEGEGWLDYRFALGLPPLSIPPAVRLDVELRRGAFDLAGRRTRALRPARNAHCPCGSGRKFKYCHGL